MKNIYSCIHFVVRKLATSVRNIIGHCISLFLLTTQASFLLAALEGSRLEGSMDSGRKAHINIPFFWDTIASP